LGDSGFVVIGPGKITYRSEMQTHAFNTPYQMSKVPPKMQAQHAIFGGSTHFSETPKDADVTKHKVQHGDIVLFATDGVWDNLSAQDVLSVVTKVMEEQGYWTETKLNETKVRTLPGTITEKNQENYLPGLIASAVMREAKIAGLDRKRNGPFAREVKLYYPQEGWQGGKPDDIAVVVAIAVENGELEDKGPIKAKL
jgi:protein phosphatase PTC7